MGMSGVFIDTPGGTPQRLTFRHVPPCSGALLPPVAVAQVVVFPAPPRESHIRRGGMLWNPPAVDPPGAAKYPSTSTITSASPTALNSVIAPPALSSTMARFASALPGARLRLEASGRLVPAGYTITTVPPLPWLMAVMFATTAAAPAGTAVLPVICDVIDPLG